jgi:hypothetical protein
MGPHPRTACGREERRENNRRRAWTAMAGPGTRLQPFERFRLVFRSAVDAVMRSVEMVRSRLEPAPAARRNPVPEPTNINAMNTRSFHLLLAGTSLALPASIASAAGPSGPQARHTVVLTGQVVTRDLLADMQDAELWLEAGGRETLVPVSFNGRFSVSVPVGGEAVLRFEKPGHQAKEVVVDTRHALVAVNGVRQRRKVSFGVVLEEDRHMAGLTYDGPVGGMSFDAEGGCLAVQHTRTVVPAERKRMEF